jgi:hypothetical protein
MSKKSIVAASVVVMLGIAALLLVKQRQVRELEEENAVLRAQLGQMTFLQDTNAHLAEQLEAAVAFSQTNQNELLRLRGSGNEISAAGAGKCAAESSASAIGAAGAATARTTHFVRTGTGNGCLRSQAAWRQRRSGMVDGFGFAGAAGRYCGPF